MSQSAKSSSSSNRQQDAEPAMEEKSVVPSRGALPFVLPFFVVLGIGMFYPDLSPPAYETEGQKLADPGAPGKYTFWVGLQFVLGIGLIAYFWRNLFSQFPLRLRQISPWALLAGVVGFFLWIGLCGLGLEKRIYPLIGLGSLVEVRPAFDPYSSIDDPFQRWLFLVLRFGLLALVIPVVEELMVRGWFARWVSNTDFESVRLLDLKSNAMWAIVVYAVLAHPSEALAAIVWFWLINFLMMRTGNLWDCVVAHMVTNLMLGLYVVNYSQWQLW